jgi:hypothetical protein
VPSVLRHLAALAILTLVPALASADPPTQPRNDTGQTGCVDMDGNPVACNAPDFPFQDGRFGRDVAAAAGVLTRTGGGVGGFDFTKIANDGSELPPDALLGNGPGDWACTRDNTTGLVWEIKTASGDRSGSYTYHWYDSNPDTNGGFSGDPGGAELSCNFSMNCDTETYVGYLDSIPLCGRSDWRLPGFDELLGVVNYGSSFPDGGAMDRSYFADGNGYSGAGGAWTGTTAHEPPDGMAAWFTNFDDGHMEAGPKGSLLPIRAVSGERLTSDGDPPVCGKRENDAIPASTAGAFTLDPEGTATDARTGLTWDRCAIGQELVDDGGEELPRCEGEAQAFNWQDAMQEVAARNASGWLGHDDWRLPNVKELYSLMERRCFGPIVDLKVFPEPGITYWTSTSSDWNPDQAWTIEFFGGVEGATPKGDASPALRLVRGGGEFDGYEGELSYRVGGTVAGLAGSDLGLRIDTGGGDGESIDVSGNGPFAFSLAFSTGDTYTVSVEHAPVPAQDCTIENGSGTVGDGDVTDVVVTCAAPPLPEITVDPGQLTFDVAENATADAPLAITNGGGGFLHWSIASAYPGSADLPLPRTRGVGVDCEGAPGLVIHDDGTVENAYTGNGAWEGGVRIVDKFTPTAYPASISAVCLAFAGSAGVDNLDFDIVVYADNGPGGAPGTELGSMAASATGIPQYPVTTPTWYGYDLSSIYSTVASGSLYVGIRWQPASPSRIFLLADESADRPAGYAGGQFWNHGESHAWAPIQDVGFTDYRSMFVRAVVGGEQPQPVGCDDPQAIAWLAVDPAAGTTLAGETSEVAVSVNASGIAAGDYSALLCVDSDDAAHPRIEVPVSLHVREAVGVLAVAPAALDFGSVALGDSAPAEDVTVSNSGAGTLGAITPEAPAAPFTASGGDCPDAPFSLAPGQSCTLAYSFAPTALGAATQTLAIGSDGGEAAITLAGTGVPGAPADLVAVSGGGQETPVGQPFPVALAVEVRDAFGTPVPGVAVDFAAPATGAGATLSAATVTTGADGRAAVNATANAVAGSYAVTATAAGIGISFALVNLPDTGADRVFANGFDGGALPAGPAWSADYDGHVDRDDAGALALDAAGNVYVTGWSVVAPGNNQYATVKYAANGTQQWVATWDDPAGMWDEAYAIAVDAAGNSVVTGRSYAGGFGAVTIKYDSDGTEQWVRRAANAGVSKSIALDADGNVYVAGVRAAIGYTTIKYDADGNEAWSRLYDAAGAEPNIGNQVVVQPGWGVYVAGLVFSADAGSSAIDYLLIRYDFDGNLIWARRYYNDQAFFFDGSLAVDAGGSAFMAGGSDDYRIVKFDASSGAVLWTATAGGAGGAVAALATDADGDVYSGGIIACDGGTVACFGVMKHDPDGGELWRRLYDPGFGGTENLVNALAVDAAGNLYATGASAVAAGSLQTEFVTAKYAPDGTEIWVEHHADGVGGSADGRAIVADAFGNAVMTGRSQSAANPAGSWDFLTIKYGSGP